MISPPLIFYQFKAAYTLMNYKADKIIIKNNDTKQESKKTSLMVGSKDLRKQRTS